MAWTELCAVQQPCRCTLLVALRQQTAGVCSSEEAVQLPPPQCHPRSPAAPPAPAPRQTSTARRACAMDPRSFTQKVTELLNSAQELAQEHNHQQLTRKRWEGRRQSGCTLRQRRLHAWDAARTHGGVHNPPPVRHAPLPRSTRSALQHMPCARLPRCPARSSQPCTWAWSCLRTQRAWPRRRWPSRRGPARTMPSTACCACCARRWCACQVGAAPARRAARAVAAGAGGYVPASQPPRRCYRCCLGSVRPCLPAARVCHTRVCADTQLLTTLLAPPSTFPLPCRSSCQRGTRMERSTCRRI